MFLITNKKKKFPERKYGPTKKIMLFTNARNEKHMKEWATHHLLIGFDYIVIFDHKSTNPLMDEFKFFDKRVKIIRCNLDNPIKMKLMNFAIQIAKLFKIDWFLYLDADEYLILNKFEGVKKMLNNFPFAHSLSINWLLFGTNNLTKEPEGLVLENYTKSTENLDQHVKTFVRPLEIVNCVNPHYFNMKFKNRMFNVDGYRMDPKLNYAFHKPILNYDTIGAYIAHYVNQSEESYYQRKILLPQDDTGHMRDKNENLHSQYNDVVNENPKNKYVPNIKKFLEKFI